MPDALARNADQPTGPVPAPSKCTKWEIVFKLVNSFLTDSDSYTPTPAVKN
jgi:hypothetical protein